MSGENPFRLSNIPRRADVPFLAIALLVLLTISSIALVAGGL